MYGKNNHFFVRYSGFLLGNGEFAVPSRL